MFLPPWTSQRLIQFCKGCCFCFALTRNGTYTCLIFFKRFGLLQCTTNPYLLISIFYISCYTDKLKLGRCMQQLINILFNLPYHVQQRVQISLFQIPLTIFLSAVVSP